MQKGSVLQSKLTEVSVLLMSAKVTPQNGVFSNCREEDFASAVKHSEI